MSDMSRNEFQPARPASIQDLEATANTPAVDFDQAREPIGIVLEIAGSGSQIAIDLQRLTDCAGNPDPSVALAGQVGSQIKIRVGKGWLLATVRNQKQDTSKPCCVLAAVDLLGDC